MKNYLIAVFFLSVHTLVAQHRFVLDTFIDVPNAMPGKCYSRCWETDTSISVKFIPEKRRKEMKQIELHAAYTYYALKQNVSVAPLQKGEVVRIEPPKYDIIRAKHKVQNAGTKWILKRTIKECLSYDPQFCLVLCLVEVPAEYHTYALQILKEPAKIIRQRPDTTLIEVLDSTSERLVRVEVPPQYKMVELSFLENPAHYRIESDKKIEKISDISSIKQNNSLTNWIFEWREVLCSSPHGHQQYVVFNRL